jgi:hypothetical protein
MGPWTFPVLNVVQGIRAGARVGSPTKGADDQRPDGVERWKVGY